MNKFSNGNELIYANNPFAYIKIPIDWQLFVFVGIIYCIWLFYVTRGQKFKTMRENIVIFSFRIFNLIFAGYGVYLLAKTYIV